jgi:hypothetical protein
MLNRHLNNFISFLLPVVEFVGNWLLQIELLPPYWLKLTSTQLQYFKLGAAATSSGSR